MNMYVCVCVVVVENGSALQVASEKTPLLSPPHGMLQSGERERVCVCVCVCVSVCMWVARGERGLVV